MALVLLVLLGALVIAAIGFGVAAFVSGTDPGLAPVEPDGPGVPLPSSRPLQEADVAALRFDTTVRGYRMQQVDDALRRAGYDLGYKQELIDVLQAEVTALRDGRVADADELRAVREAAGPPKSAPSRSEQPSTDEAQAAEHSAANAEAEEPARDAEESERDAAENEIATRLG